MIYGADMLRVEGEPCVFVALMFLAVQAGPDAWGCSDHAIGVADGNLAEKHADRLAATMITYRLAAEIGQIDAARVVASDRNDFHAGHMGRSRVGAVG